MPKNLFQSFQLQFLLKEKYLRLLIFTLLFLLLVNWLFCLFFLLLIFCRKSLQESKRSNNIQIFSQTKIVQFIKKIYIFIPVQPKKGELQKNMNDTIRPIKQAILAPVGGSTLKEYKFFQESIDDWKGDLTSAKLDIWFKNEIFTLSFPELAFNMKNDGVQKQISMEYLNNNIMLTTVLTNVSSYQKQYNLKMSEEAPEAPPEKTQQQIDAELKQKQEEERLKEEERKKAEEEARIKAEEDLKKLEEALKGALTGLSKTANNKTMAYTRLNLSEKQLERLFPVILRFKQTRFLDLNTNALPDISLADGFENLVWLNASKNQISNIDMFAGDKLDQLQNLNLSGNKIKALTCINLPSLRRLNLTENEISEVSWKGHNTVQVLELRKNKLRKLKGIANMKNLKQLYVCENELTDIRGLENLPLLHRLSVRNNKIKTILSPFPQLASLSYLNLRQNQIAKLQELKKIDVHVTGINLMQNPISQELGQNFKKEACYLVPHLTKINKSEVTIEERVAFEKEMLEKLAEKQRERLAAEAEEEAKKAEAANE